MGRNFLTHSAGGRMDPTTVPGADPLRDLRVFAITVHAVGTLLVAGLLWQLTRVVHGRFLRYWAVGWAALAVALLALRGSHLPEMPGWLKPVGLGVYCGCEYVFGFLLWAGVRTFAHPADLTRWDWWPLAPLAVFAVAGPYLIGSVYRLFPFHAIVLASLFLRAGWEAWHCPPAGPGVGLRAVRTLLLGLGLLFLHYGPASAWALYAGPPYPAYLSLSPVYDALIELGLAFGMVVMTVERVLDELRAKNAELADATRRLAEAARTDALTGLLNRRAFDDLPATFTDRPFAGTLAVLDVNDLKPLNDRYGHAAGDAALQTVARGLRNAFRVTDPLFRIGGDEFVVVVEELGEADLIDRMGKVEAALASVRLPGVPEPLPIRVAWGVAGFAPGGFAAAVTAADRDMYAAKEKMKGVGSVVR
jgi:diguanylate cyclase (GGDEF)-like protein